MFKAALLGSLILAGTTAAAATDDGVVLGSRPGVSFGGRGAYMKPKAGEGQWGGGAQLRFHMSSALALEGSADLRQQRFGDTVVDLIPVQASLLVYLFPGQVVSPYLLGGAGWYYTHIKAGAPFNDRTDHRFGPHAGGGLQAWFSKRWSIDGSYRYIWLSSYRSQDASHPLGRDIDDSGYMITGALNFHF